MKIKMKLPRNQTCSEAKVLFHLKTLLLTYDLPTLQVLTNFLWSELHAIAKCKKLITKRLVHAQNTHSQTWKMKNGSIQIVRITNKKKKQIIIKKSANRRVRVSFQLHSACSQTPRAIKQSSTINSALKTDSRNTFLNKANIFKISI